MADANWLRKAPPTTDSNDDPFAELTRIMGFDPRVPFRGSQQAAAVQTASFAPAAPQQVAAPKVDLSDDDLDLSIDLERELMGALEPEVAELAHVHAAQHAPAAVTPRFAQQAPAVEDREEPPLDQQAYGNAWPAEYSQADYSPADEAAFAEYVAAEEPVPATAETAYDHARYAEEETDYDASDYVDDAASYAPPASDASGQHAGVAYDEPDHAADLAAHLDEELEASFENELAGEGDEWLNEGDATYAAESREDAYAVQPTELPRQVDEFADDFDTAMAEVDMDFTAAPAASAAEEAVDEAVRYAAQTELEHELGSAFADDFGAEADIDAAHARNFEDAPARASAAPADEWEPRGEPVALPAYPSQAFGDEAAVEPVAEAQPEEDAAQSEIDDAIAELAAMVRGYDRPQPALAAPENVVRPFAPAQAWEDTPDIETVDVPEGAVALADDLDIPEVDYSEDAAPQFDDLDAELAAAFGEPAIETIQPAPVEARTPSQDFDLGGGYDPSRNAAFQAAPYAVAAGAGAAAVHYAQGSGRDDDFEVNRRVTAQAQDDDFDFDSELDDELALAGDPMAQERPSPRRGLIIASIVGGIAVIGAIGAFALSGGDGIASGEPALVKADADPIKVKPENPGGAIVPNQESQVFDRAAGGAPAAPDQQQLISNEEEPVDVASRFPDALPEPIDESADINEPAEASAKDEDRIDQVIADDETQPAGQETIAVTPRKVRTMVVKSDGTLVPREEVTDEPETVGSTTAAGSLTDPTISAPQAGAPAAELPAADAAQPAAAGQAPAAPAQEAATAPAAEAPRAARSNMPDSVPVAPSRPADQPLDIVGEVKPDQVAALQPAAASAAGSWSMQIASQPSEAAAQSSYKDLARRYSGVLGGRSANIVKAEIAGKGTFWRVRVPAGSRNEAIKLCESYKSAGGNCFVSK